METKRQIKIDPKSLNARRAELNGTNGGLRFDPAVKTQTFNGQPVIDRTQTVRRLHPEYFRA